MGIKLLWSSFFTERQKKKALKARLHYAMTQNASNRKGKKEN